MRGFCWFHEFDHPFDGVSDGWMCHAYEPRVVDDVPVIAPNGGAA